MDYQLCPQCDGMQYQRLANDFACFGWDLTLSSNIIKHPFSQRIFAPILAAVIPLSNINTSFSTLNLLFCILTCISLLVVWTKLEFKPILIVFGFIWFLFHWSGIVRYYAFDPLSVDVPVYFFHAVLILIILSKRYYFLWIIAPFAMATKESFLAYIVLFILYALLHNRLYATYFRMRHIWIALLVSVLTKLFITAQYTGIAEDKNALFSLLYYGKEIFEEPLILVRWVIALFTVGGVFLLLALKDIRKHFNADPEQNLILIFSIVSILFGLLAGHDRTRIMMIGLPFILTSIFYLVRNRGNGVLIVTMLLSIPLMRVASVIPKLDAVGYKNWYPEYGAFWMVCAWGLYMIIAYFVISKTEHYFSRK